MPKRPCPFDSEQTSKRPAMLNTNVYQRTNSSYRSSFNLNKTNVHQESAFERLMEARHVVDTKFMEDQLLRNAGSGSEVCVSCSHAADGWMMCSFCERNVCSVNCTRLCRNCQNHFCPLCSIIRYDLPYVSSLCLTCSGLPMS